MDRRCAIKKTGHPPLGRERKFITVSISFATCSGARVSWTVLISTIRSSDVSWRKVSKRDVLRLRVPNSRLCISGFWRTFQVPGFCVSGSSKLSGFYLTAFRLLPYEYYFVFGVPKRLRTSLWLAQCVETPLKFT
jgi:hypothetical protein